MKCPLAVLIVACLYIVVGTLGFFNHLSGIGENYLLRYDGLWIEVTELVAIVCGVFLLRGRDWARLLAIVWMLFHVVIRFLHSYREVAVHALLCAVIGWLLFRPDSTRYFRQHGIAIKL